MKRRKELALITALLVISAAPRLPGIGKFTSIDEPFWLRQSANFYYALGQRDFRNTLYEYHPAVTTMWIITAGMLVYFPEYRALGQGYLKPGKVDLFFLEHGKHPLQLLIASRVVQVILILALLAVIYLFLRMQFGQRTAFFTTALISLSPFLIGQSRLLNHEAMVGLLSVLALLALFVYLHGQRHVQLLLLSGAAAGLAQVTKSSAMPIVPLALLMVMIHAMTGGEATFGRRLVDTAKTYAIWLASAAAAYVVIWPGMWVAPAQMLSDVYGNAISYAVQGARTSVVPAAGASAFGVAALAQGIGIYMNDLLWRTTPITGLGLLAGTLLAIFTVKADPSRSFKWLVLYALLLAIAFVLLFGMQRSPKPPHYLTSSYVALDLIAGLGLMRLWDRLQNHWARLRSPRLAAAWLAGLLALQAASATAFYPYYISYYNPIVEAVQPGIQNPTLNENGYGMGLDQAAGYLAQKPYARELTVLSAHGLGSFSYYFPGTTIAMNDLDMSDPLVAGAVREADYVVVDYFNQARKDIARDLEGVDPEQSVWLNHREFLRIYRAVDILEQSH